MHIEFHGAAREVTSSCYPIEAGGHRLLVECGLFQGSAPGLSNPNTAGN